MAPCPAGEDPRGAHRGASLGAENIRTSLLAALSGLLLVAVFMVVVYRLAGVVAVFALSLYGLFNLAAYALIPVTLTLPGIAGFILSLGMAVDANVLIFERIKEELRSGNTLIRSIETGFSLAFSSILDGQVTTLISCVALFALGTGFVKGFAVTLGIGVLLSLFSALTCTRTLLRVVLSYPALRRIDYFLPLSQRSEEWPEMLAFRVNRQRRLLWLISLVALLLSVLGMAISWSRPGIGAPLRPGLDFTGGTQIQIERRCESSCPALSVAELEDPWPA